MHIAIVCRDLGSSGSVAAVALRQARELSRHTRVTLLSDSFPPGVDGVRIGVPNLARLRRFRHVLDEIAFARKARRALAEVRADFVLAHGHAPSYLAARHAGVPHALFVHADIDDRPRGTYDARLTAFYRWVTPRAYRSASVVVVLAAPFAERARRAGARRVEVVPHGIDVEELAAAAPAAREPGTPLRVLFAGRLAVEKGVGDLLDAADGLDVELTIAGSGPLEAKLRAAASPRVRFLGHVARASLGPVYAAHHLFCAPSLSEPFGLAVAEALACGLPVVATEVGGIPTLVEHGRNGLLVPPRDPRALANAVALLAADEPLRRRLAAQATPSVLPRLRWEAIGERIFAVIRGAAS